MVVSGYQINRMGEDSFPFMINEFEFRGLLGRGTYSIVYDVYSMKYKSEFAAKVTPLDESTLSSDVDFTLDAELLSLSRLNHPNIIRFYNYFKFDTNLIIILEKCVGGSLAEKIQRREIKFNLSEVRKYMLEILSALEYCHHRDIAHMDIKPNNIFFDSYNRAKIADFGLAIVLHKQQLVDTQCGSYNYVAPEILYDQPYDAKKTDIWSLGVTFYEMLTCELPWPEETPMDERTYENIHISATLNPQFVDLIRIMLNRDPAQRPSVQEIMKHKFFTPPVSPTPNNHMKRIDLSRKPLSSKPSVEHLPLTMKSTCLMSSQLILKSPQNALIIQPPRQLNRRNTIHTFNPQPIMSD